MTTDYSKIPWKELKPWDRDNLDMLMLHEDRNHVKTPFFIRYGTKDGGRIEADNVICTSVDHAHGNRRVKFLNTLDAVSGNAETRTLRDIRIMQINQYRIEKG